jgi:Family of unknown function (DUF6328)
MAGSAGTVVRRRARHAHTGADLLVRAVRFAVVPESQDEQLNRNLDQLLQELRVVLPGVQVLFAFLLIAPFSSRFAQVDDFERDIYFVALLLAAVAVALLMAPSIQHRILFRRDQKRYLVNLGSALMIAGMTALAFAIVLSLVFVAHFLFGPGAAFAAGGLSFVAFAVLWYALPIERRLTNRDPDERVPPAG